MRDQLGKLEVVQELDIQIGNILNKKAEFPKRLAAFEAELKTFNNQIAEKEKSIAEVDKTKKQYVGALELNNDREKRSTQKGEGIKNQQEFSAVQKELEGLKKSSEMLAENIKKADADIAKFNAEIAEINKKADDVKAKHGGESDKIAGEMQTLNVDLAALEAKRKDAIVGVDPRMLASYDRIRTARQNVGLAIANGGHCRACNVKLPPQMFNELQKANEIINCPSCKRILMFKNSGS